MFRSYCLLQEKGDMDQAIQCYEHAIQVIVLCYPMTETEMGRVLLCHKFQFSELKVSVMGL